MITEDYVSFETAKLLKEKGFDIQGYASIKVFGGNTYEVNGEWINVKEDTIIPTLQMAMKWLREVHNLIILVEVERVKYGNVRYNWSIIDDNSDYSVTVRAKYPTYEGACEAAIKYYLENLI